MNTSRPPEHAAAIPRSIALLVLSVALGAKVLLANDLSLTFAEDPVELWVALGVCSLLAERALELLLPAIGGDE